MISSYNVQKQIYSATSDSTGELLVVLKTSISEEALQRCAAREMMSAVQELRKTSGLVLKDVVDIFMECDSKYVDFVKTFCKKSEQAIISRIKFIPTLGKAPGVVFATSSVTCLKHDAKRSFELKISFTKQTPIVDRAALLSKTKDESVVDMISSLVSMMSVSDLPSKGNSLTLGAFKQGKQVSLNDRVTVTLTRGSELFGSAGEMSGRK